MKTILVLGDMTITKDTAIVHKIQCVLTCESPEKAEECGEGLINGDYNHVNYIVPSIYNGKIVWECGFNYYPEKQLKDDLTQSYNEIEEVHTNMTTFTDEEIIECKSAIISRVETAMRILDKYVSDEDILSLQ